MLHEILQWKCHIRINDVIKTKRAALWAYRSMSCASRVQFSTQCAAQCGWGDKPLPFVVVTADYPPRVLASCKLTVDSEAPCGRLSAGRVAGSTRVVPGITPTGWADHQRAAWEGDSRVGGDGDASFAPLDCNRRPGYPRAIQRHVFILHCHWGNRHGHPSHCIYKGNGGGGRSILP